MHHYHIAILNVAVRDRLQYGDLCWKMQAGFGLLHGEPVLASSMK